MKRKLLFLINPISGTKKKGKLVEIIHRATTKKAILYEVAHTRADGNYSYLPEYLRENGFTDIVICGGDGSVSTVTSFLLDCDIAVGIVPTGSGNGLALTARIPYSTSKALEIIFAGNSSYIDGFRINGQFSCMMCGIGNDAEIAHEFALTKVRGLKTYLKLSFKKYLSLRPYSFTLQTGKNEINVDAFFISVSNSNQFGNYVTIAPRASLNDGLLDIVVVRKMNRLKLPFALLQQITGFNKLTQAHLPSPKASIFYFQGTELMIRNHDQAPIHIDGEPRPAVREIHLQVLPNAFRLLQPSRRS